MSRVKRTCSRTDPVVWTTTTEPAQNKVATLIAFADGLFAHHQVEAVSFFYIVVRFVDFHSLLGRSHGPWKAAGGGGHAKAPFPCRVHWFLPTGFRLHWARSNWFSRQKPFWVCFAIVGGTLNVLVKSPLVAINLNDIQGSKNSQWLCNDSIFDRITIHSPIEDGQKTGYHDDQTGPQGAVQPFDRELDVEDADHDLFFFRTIRFSSTSHRCRTSFWLFFQDVRFGLNHDLFSKEFDSIGWTVVPGRPFTWFFSVFLRIPDVIYKKLGRRRYQPPSGYQGPLFQDVHFCWYRVLPRRTSLFNSWCNRAKTRRAVVPGRPLTGYWTYKIPTAIRLTKVVVPGCSLLFLYRYRSKEST